MQVRNKQWLMMAIVVGLAGVGIWQASAVRAQAPAVATKPALTVTLTQLSAQESAVTVSANGTVAAWQEAIVGAQIGGLRLSDVLVNVGDAVKRGQTLARFDRDTVLAEIASTRAGMAEANAAIADAKFNADRGRSLETSGAISAQQINQFNAALTMAQARLDAAKARLRSDELRLKFTAVVAPDDGVVTVRSANLGMVPQAGQELFRLIRKNRLEWRAEVTAGEMSRLLVGQSVTVTLPNAVKVLGKVRLVSPQVDAQTRNALVYVDIPVGSPARAGMFARGEFETGRSNAQTLPQTAVLTRDGFNYVFAVDKNNKVAMVKVTVGRRLADRVEVLQGLAGGTSVVASGAGFLADGDLVRVVAR
jgi:RND family efflux transporter MFP subunit